MKISEVLYVATYAGKIMLESGGETYRVEETINRICTVYGAKEVDSFVTPTVIIVSVVNDGETVSLVKRISNRSVDLNKIDKINDLSRNIARDNLGISQLNEQLKKIELEDRYSKNKTIFFSALGAFGFVFLFKGSLRDGISAFLIGLVVKSTMLYIENIKINTFFVNTIVSSVLAFLAIVLVNIGVGQDIDKVIISSLMLLVPGLSITNAIRDAVAGDLVSGVARATEAFLVAISVALGTGIVLSFWTKVFGGIILC